jgi:uncharacterized protein YecT (DUF1311 family)
MPNPDFSPDLSKLDKNYQVLTELHAEGDSRTYLARHLQLNRDVVITVVRAPAPDDGNALTHFAADAKLLTTMRHPNVIPVIEGIWLDDRTFAVVRARVRGSTLDQLISAVGPVPIARVSTTIQQIHAALAWARAGGVVHRRITPHSVIFQQGNGRVLIALEPAALTNGAPPDECDDAQMLGRIASDMLSGQIDGGEEPVSGVVVPPRIVPGVARALEAVRRCDLVSAPKAVDELLAALEAGRETESAVAEPVTNAVAVEEPAPSPATIATPVAASVPPRREVPRPSSRTPMSLPVRPPMRRSSVPVDASDPAVVIVKPAFDFNARLGTAIAVAAIIVVMALVLFHRRGTDDLRASASSADTTQQAAGDIAPSTRFDSSTMASSTPPVLPSPPPAQPNSASTQMPVTQPGVIPRSPIMPPDTPRHEPPRVAPPLRFPAPGAAAGDSLRSSSRDSLRDSATVAERRAARASDSSSAMRKPARDSAAPTSDACASPDPADQHKCLIAAIDRNDRELNGVYARLISALRRQAGAASGDPDPETVDQLRAAQRKWVDERDTSCRDVGDGPLYARSRSACFAQASANRARELQRMIDAIPPI